MKSAIKWFLLLALSFNIYAATSNGQVDLRATVSREFIYKSVYLMDGSESNAGQVNGASVNKEYTFAPSSDEVWFLERLVILILDPGTADATNFGAIGGLTNGCKIEVKSNGATSEYINLKNNMDISTGFPDYNGGVSQTGLLSYDEAYVGYVDFKNPISLKGGMGDYVKLTVRDNLSNVLYFKIKVILWSNP